MKIRSLRLLTLAAFPALVGVAAAANPPELAVAADKKFAALKELVHRARIKPTPTPPKRISGLSPAEEARLFGGNAGPANSAPDPAKANFAGAWPRYMSAAEHKRWVEELQANRPLRLELRKHLASQPSTISAEDKETTAELNALLTEAEKRAGELPKDDGALKPLSPEDAFGLDPGGPHGSEAK